MLTVPANVVQANLLAATAKCYPGLVINCACHEQTTLIELINEINIFLHKKIKPTYANSRPGDIKHSFASIDRAKVSIGYIPLIGFREGLSKTISWFLSNKI